MKRFHIILVYIICSLFFSSCVNRKELATNAVNELFSYIKNDKDNIITEIYPAASNLPSYYKSDNIKINEVKRLNDKKIAVLIENNFTNGFGKSLLIYQKLIQKNILFTTAKDSVDMKIIVSSNLL